MGYLAEALGATIGAYLILRLTLFIHRKVRRQEESQPIDAALCGVLTLAIATVLRGYGDSSPGAPPEFLAAFAFSLGPVMLATVIEMSRRLVRG